MAGLGDISSQMGELRAATYSASGTLEDAVKGKRRRAGKHARKRMLNQRVRAEYGDEYVDLGLHRSRPSTNDQSSPTSVASGLSSGEASSTGSENVMATEHNSHGDRASVVEERGGNGSSAEPTSMKHKTTRGGKHAG